jgi:uncharacterized protein YecE (DUF72 family)
MEPPPAHSDNNSHDEQGGNDIFIGTAGYSYAHWRQGVFYPLGVTQLQELRHYSGVFSAVEINASFHAVPREETLLKWAKNAKPGFLFSFKVPQAITHEKRLENIEQALDYFLTRLLKMSGIRPCLGPILFQLPPSLPKDISKLDRLSRLIPKGIRVAFEFRNKTWYCSDVYDAMRRYGFGLCDNISPDESKLRVAGSNIEAATTAKVWHYIRCHKRANQQITDYTKEQLIKIADQLVERRNRNIAQYCFFLNDHEGNGPRNAKTLLNLIKERSGNTQGLVQKWKSDPVAPSISSMFAKSNATSANKAATSTTATTQSPLLQTVSKAKKTPRSIDSFFSPSNDKITPPSITKRRKTSTTPKGKKGSISDFFASKKSS